MFDPRDDIIALFTNSIISTTASYGYGTDYIKIDLREDNPEGTIDYKNYAGCMLLESPEEGTPRPRNIGGGKDETPIVITCNLWIRKKKGMKDLNKYINGIIDTFQKTIRTNQLDVVTNGILRNGGFRNLQATNPDLIRKVGTIYAYKYE